VVTVVVVAIITFVAAIAFLPQLARLGNPGSGSTAVHGVRASLCKETLGVNCPGNSVALPLMGRDASSHTSACDSIPGLGAHEHAWPNYTATSPIYGLVIPLGKYTGVSSWSVDPSGFLNNSSSFHTKVWFSGLAAGAHEAVVSIPTGTGSWCLGWYEPQSSSTVPWNNDRVLTYQMS
jgi:hypothetical protein